MAVQSQAPVDSLGVLWPRGPGHSACHQGGGLFAAGIQGGNRIAGGTVRNECVNGASVSISAMDCVQNSLYMFMMCVGIDL